MMQKAGSAVKWRGGFHGATTHPFCPAEPTIMIIPHDNPTAQQARFLDLFGPLDLHRPERHHLLDLSEALIVTRGTKTTSSLAHSQPDGPDRSCLSRFLAGSWDEQALLAAGREALLEQLRQQTEPTALIYHSVDDTANPHAPSRLIDPWLRPPSHMEAVDRHYDHIQRRCRWAHSVVTSQLSCANWSLPWRHELYRRKEDCAQAGVVFHSKQDLAVAMIEQFEPPHKGQPVCHLLDSWYTNGRTLGTVRARPGHLLIGTVICRTKLKIGEKEAKLSQWASELRPEELDRVKVGASEYEVHRFEGHVFDQERPVVVLATRPAGKTKKDWTFILSSETGLGTAQIMAHYAVRWDIETGHWYLKCALGFGDYRLRPLRAIRRFWAAVLFTYWYLEWLRHRLKLATLADTQRRVISAYERWWTVRVWEKSRHCASLEEVWAVMKMTA